MLAIILNQKNYVKNRKILNRVNSKKIVNSINFRLIAKSKTTK